MALSNPGATRHGKEVKRLIGAVGRGKVCGQNWTMLELEAGTVDQGGTSYDQRVKGNGGRQLEQSLLNATMEASIYRKTVSICPLLIFGRRGQRGTDPAVPGAKVGSYHTVTAEA